MLGGILLSDRAMYGLVIEEGLKAEDSHRDRHRLIYESMIALYREQPIDVLTVCEHLRSRASSRRPGRPRSTSSPAACQASAVSAATPRSCASTRSCAAC